MVSREDVVGELQKVPDKHLDEIYRILKEYEETGEQSAAGQSVMSRLRQIRISATTDFSTTANLDDPEERDAG